MSRTGSRSLLIAASAAFGVVVLVAIGIAATRGRPASVAPELSTATLAVDLPPGLRATKVEYLVTSAGGAALARGTLPVDASGAVVPRQVVLPVGTGHVVTYRAAVAADGARSVAPIVAIFDVSAGRDTFVRGATATPSAEGAPAAATAAALARIDTRSLTAAIEAPAVGRDALASCQACQRANSTGRCDPPFLTATSDTNPATGEQTAIGWGCATLLSDIERKACAALLRCLNSHDCSDPQSPVMPCYCGGTDPTACITGNEVDGACAGEYQAAAVAGVAAAGGAPTVAQISRIIATAASDPTTAVGLASNLRQCAGQAGCSACERL